MSYGGGATIRQPFCWTPAASPCGQRQTEKPQRLRTSCPKGREGSGYIPTYSPPARHLASIRVLKTASSARATGPQGILGVVVSVGKVALVTDGRREGRVGGSLWPAFVMASWVAKGAQTTQSPPSHFW